MCNFQKHILFSFDKYLYEVKFFHEIQIHYNVSSYNCYSCFGLFAGAINF